MDYVYLKSDKADPKEGEHPQAVMRVDASQEARIEALKENGWVLATEEEYLSDNPEKE